ncbi:SDR family NAD(P)-dependent oxidoreductase [Chitinophaga solisilvae]|uniref:SDR family NAD(P)-dependent oxidoreductase n=1 Tax=Chitinophaga solisilvae TaxID=1233460 RepID=UPI00136ECEDD|nr:SDR family NAD(P)-dependent oxidoreductase [Chitinophaga solisilvae]
MNETRIKISILSCGWLGKPLALYLQGKGYSVKGARTSPEGVEALQQEGIDAYRVRLDETGIEAPESFWDADILIFNVPPRKERGAGAHVTEMQLLRNKLENTGIRRVLFVSSTSVYAEVNDLVTEANMVIPETPNGQALREVESLLLASPVFRTTVLRFGGLIGYDRIPTEEALKTGRRANDVPMNVIHRDDCIGVIHRVIEKDVWGEIFNACASGHPIRYNYYRAAAAALGLEMPKKLQPKEMPYKIVSSGKLKQRLGYQFIFDDPIAIFNDPEAGRK